MRPTHYCFRFAFGSPGDSYFDDVSVALGNIALVDHGYTVAAEQLPEVPQPNPVLARGVAVHCQSLQPAAAASHGRAIPAGLEQAYLTHVPGCRLEQSDNIGDREHGIMTAAQVQRFSSPKTMAMFGCRSRIYSIAAQGRRSSS